MSFILDALRKSEQERQSNQAPGIADIRSTKKKASRGIWLPLVGLLAGLNLALLAMLWFMGEDQPETAAPAAAVKSRPAPTPGYPSQPAVSTGTATESNIEADLEPARFASISPPVQSSTPVAQASGKADDNARVPTVAEAMLDGSLSIKPLHLDLHVNSDNSAERFVFINTSRYGEGDRLSEGPTVKRINKQGVILNYQGRDYLLARD
jgi:general secretion pathway protein B